MAKKTHPQTAVRKDAKYPYNSLSQAIQVGQAVADHGGDRAQVPKSVIASQLSMGEGQSLFAQIVASAKIFGLVDGMRALVLTEVGKEYFFPTSETGKELSLLAFIGSPPAYRFLIERFDGNRMPHPTIMANLVKRECGVPESWATRVATMFVSIMTDANLIDGTGHLRYGAGLHSLQSGSTQQRPLPEFEEPTIGSHPAPITAISLLPSKNQLPVSRIASSPEINVWVFTEDGRTVRLETPDQLSKKLWDRLKKYVDVLEPSDPDHR